MTAWAQDTNGQDLGNMSQGLDKAVLGVYESQGLNILMGRTWKLLKSKVRETSGQDFETMKATILRH